MNSTVKPFTEEAQAPAERSWILSPAEYQATVERFAKINARAAKRGFTGHLSIAGIEREVTERDSAGFILSYIVMDTTITGEAPCYNGWEFLASVDTVELEDGPGYVLRTAPGVSAAALDRSNLLPGQCQHCHATRSNRIYTYLVRNIETGETVQVGSTCIKDFTGWDGKPTFINTDELAHELDNLGGGPAFITEYTPETVVALSWGISRLYGWTSSASAYEGHPATRNLVEAYLYGNSKADNELRTEVGPAITANQDQAKTIIATLLEELTEDGGYGSNMLVCLRGAHVHARHMGLVVSAVAAYEKVTGARIQRETKKAAAKNSKFAGTPGEKITLTGRITRLLPVENNFGYTTTTSMLVIIEDDTTVAKMFTTAKWAFSVNQGDEITISATIKDHEDYQGIKQTVLTRPKRT